MKHVIEIQQLKKSYGTTIAVKNLTLNVREGEIYGLIGPNGAGKSTTIDCLLGIKKKDEGHVSILNLDPRKDRKELFAKIGVQYGNC